jgi:hypothetical protein
MFPAIIFFNILLFKRRNVVLGKQGHVGNDNRFAKRKTGSNSFAVPV